jgi:HEPN domain-containing protein
MLKITGKISSDNMQTWQLFDSAKADYVVARTCLQTGPYLRWPGFQLIQQSLENFIKAILKNKGISWPIGSDGHDFIKLLEKGSANGIVLFKVLLSRVDICSLLKELQAGYNPQRYGEAGHFIDDHDTMMDLFDETAYLLLTEYSSYFKKIGGHRDSMRFGLHVPEYLDQVFSRRLKQPFEVVSIPSI